MPIYKLEPINPDSGPWDPWYDKCFGFVVRAKSQKEARKLAAEQNSGEGTQAWLSPALSTCKPVRTTGKAEVILLDEHWA